MGGYPTFKTEKSRAGRSERPFERSSGGGRRSFNIALRITAFKVQLAFLTTVKASEESNHETHGSKTSDNAKKSSP